MSVKAEIRQVQDGMGDNERRFDVLFVNSRPLMWDTAAERAGQAEMLKDCHGDVLVAGYGLGVGQRILMANPRVNKVTTVEKYIEVISACSAHYGTVSGSYVIADIFDFLNNIADQIKWEFIVGDIWSGSPMADVAGYKKFRKAATPHLKPGGKIVLGGRDL